MLALDPVTVARLTEWKATAGIHLKIVSARRGHASAAFTARIYQPALPGMDREATRTIAALTVGEVGKPAS